MNAVEFFYKTDFSTKPYKLQFHQNLNRKLKRCRNYNKQIKNIFNNSVSVFVISTNENELLNNFLN